MGLSGESSKGIFPNSTRYYGQGRNFRRGMGALERFAEQLSRHIDQADLDAGRNLATGEKLPDGAELDPGGNAKEAAQRIGAKAAQGNAMLQRIRQRLGPQAR
jgi:hypothetical protein